MAGDYITPEEIERTKMDMKALFPEKLETDLALIQKFAIAQEIVIRTLGADWWKEHMTSAGEPRGYLRNQPTNEEEVFEHQDRVIELGDMLFMLRDVPNFEHVVERLKAEKHGALEDVVFELIAAKLFFSSGHPIEFVLPPGTRQTYDLHVDYRGHRLPVEVRCRREDSAASRQGLRDRLNEARKKLPKGGPSVIVVRLHKTWVEHADFAREIVEEIEAFFRSTTRVNDVVLVWDEWIVHPKGRARVRRFRHFLNRRAAVQIDSLADLIERVTSPSPSSAEPSFWTSTVTK